MIIYTKLKLKIIRRGENWLKFCDNVKISRAMAQRIKNNDSLSLSIIDKICKYFNCQPGDIMEWVDDDYDGTIEEKILEEYYSKIKKLKKV